MTTKNQFRGFHEQRLSFFNLLKKKNSDTFLICSLTSTKQLFFLAKSKNNVLKFEKLTRKFRYGVSVVKKKNEDT